MDCGFDTLTGLEYYTVEDEVWLLAHPADYGMLCIGCLEARLGRRLNSKDFIDFPINIPDPETKSERLINRITSD